MSGPRIPLTNHPASSSAHQPFHSVPNFLDVLTRLALKKKLQEDPKEAW
jgi:hypothetical protein